MPLRFVEPLKSARSGDVLQMMTYFGEESANNISVRSVPSVAGVFPVWRRRRNYSYRHVPHRPSMHPPPLLPLRYQSPASDPAMFLPTISIAVPLRNDRDPPLLPPIEVLRRPAALLSLPAPTLSFRHRFFQPPTRLRRDLGKTSTAKGSRLKRTGGEGDVPYGPYGDTRTASCACKLRRTLPTPPSQFSLLDHTTVPHASGTSRPGRRFTVWRAIQAPSGPFNLMR